MAGRQSQQVQLEVTPESGINLPELFGKKNKDCCLLLFLCICFLCFFISRDIVSFVHG
ncbi:hypothetical protein BJX68DRAFT_239734 [Aspergillus pseudodeflectus]|uniref:Uncharacterized protein n=1 Tax=Aspergillus pseudodeflectus TaxID=176178 RepID=A0ABR4K4M4_9EURO